MTTAATHTTHTALTHLDIELLKTTRRQGTVSIAVLTMQHGDAIGAAERLQLLVRCGYLQRRRGTNGAGRTVWLASLTDAGADALDAYLAGHLTPSRTLVAASSTGPYVPHELRPFDGRPGAMRAYALPSLINGQRVHRRAANDAAQEVANG